MYAYIHSYIYTHSHLKVSYKCNVPSQTPLLTWTAKLSFTSGTNDGINTEAQVKGQSTQDCPHFQMPATSDIPKTPELLSNWLQIQGVPRTPIRFDNSLEQLSELRKALY